MNGRCDWEGCNEESVFSDKKLGLELCEKHYNVESEPQITLLRYPFFREIPKKDSTLVRKIVHTLKSNGKRMRVGELQQSISMETEEIFDSTIEDMIVKGVVLVT